MVGDIKHIIVIQSLFADEVASGKELYNDIISRQIERQKSLISHSFFEVNSKDSFLEILNYAAAQAPYIPGGLLIHLEMHGSSDLDGLVLSDHSIVSWVEIADKMRSINIGTCNRLYITMATCFGRYLYKGVDPYKKSPYSGYISASKAVRAEEIIEDFGVVFDSLITGGNLVQAFLDLEKKGSDFYYKDSKTTFIENVKDVRDHLDNDPKFRADLIKEIQQDSLFVMGNDNEEDIEIMIKMAYNDIVRRQRQAFEFHESD